MAEKKKMDKNICKMLCFLSKRKTCQECTKEHEKTYIVRLYVSSDEGLEISHKYLRNVSNKFTRNIYHTKDLHYLSKVSDLLSRDKIRLWF